MTIKLVTTALLLFAAFNIMAFGHAESKPAEEENIAEAVYRYQMQHCYREGPPRVYFLQRAGKDPADKFMNRFKDAEPPVKKRSQIGNLDGGNEFMDKETGKFAVLLGVDKIKRLGDDGAEVEGSCGAASWAAKGYKYSLTLEKDKWVIKEVEPTWVW